MKILNMDFGYDGEYNLDNIFAMEQYWNERLIFNMQTPRNSSALLYAKECEIEYTWDNFVLNVKKGEVVYIPQGSIYNTKFINTVKNEVSTMLIEFVMFLPDGEPAVFGTAPMLLNKNTVGVSEYFSEMVHLFKTPVSSPALKKSLLYKIISTIGYEERTSGLLRTEFAPIAKGIIYMENDISQEKSISQIAELCHVSPSYFRKLFKKYSGVSPIEYQIKVKISHAKDLIRTNTMRISEVSDALGFFDAAYFCKMFKKYTGVSPKEYKNSFNSKHSS